MESSMENELLTELVNFEQVDGQELYQPLLQQELLCGHKQWIRALKEARALNADFHTLRTYMAPVSGIVGVLHYLMYPADGAMADKPLCGRVLIPKGYPTVPPVVHLLTPTNRFNVDIYHMYTQPEFLSQMHSSMCFDILRSKASGGLWVPEFTLSALISSLLQSIVSLKVPQQYGPDKDEYVTMESLDTIHKSVEQTFAQNKLAMPSRKEIKKIEAVSVPTQYLDFPETSITSYKDDGNKIVWSNRIKLQVPGDKMKDYVYSIGFDLSDLKTNPYTVFSIVLSNNPKDPIGRYPDTILVRNGVTATAAKKRGGRETSWFYHGKPMNQQDLRLVVSIGYNQFCISYLEGYRTIVHGDCPVSFLTPAEIGKVGGWDFYLSVVMKNKGGKQITVKTFKPDSGYLHPVCGVQPKPKAPQGGMDIE